MSDDKNQEYDGRWTTLMERNQTSLRGLAEDLVSYGQKFGADEVEATVFETAEFSVDVRLGRIEDLVEAGSKYIGLKVIKGKKTAYATSSDLSADTLERLVKNAVRRASCAHPDEFSGLPSLQKSETDIQELRLYDPAVPEMGPDQKISLAMETERIALAEKGITNSHGASFETKAVNTILANSNGFLDGYEETFCSLSLGLQAGETDTRAEGYWFSAQRHFEDVEAPEEVAKKAVARTLRQLGPKKIKTQFVPVLFEPMMTSWLLGFLFACVSGIAVYRKASFLADSLGERIAGENITVVDDGLLPGKLGTRPFDSEGVSTQKTTVIQKGELLSFLCNTYAARKLGLASTASADGPGVGPNNFYLQAGKDRSTEMIRSMDKGLILTRTIGHGLNPITGDISCGAFGLWIENGEICYPVSEITISGNLGEFLTNIAAIGNDLDFRTSVCGPSVLIKDVLVSGE